MLNVGVIGIGKLGNIHLRIYSELKEISKIYIADTDPLALAQHPTYPAFTNYKALADKVNLVSIVTPTNTHFEIARFFLERGIPVLLEKPITQNVTQALKLLSIAQKNKTLFFVGHVERYNNAYLAIKKIVDKPLFIECHRLSPFPGRSLDIGVILDLMIHDLDIVLDLVKDKIKRVDAKGVKVISSTEDIANTRITFAKGCVANITASRISAKKERKIRIFMPNCYISLDYAGQEVEIFQKQNNTITKKTLPITKEEPLKKEIIEFINLVKRHSHDISYAQRAKDALALALRIQNLTRR